MPLPIIQLHHVSKRYDSLVAVDDVSLSVEQGKLLALLGPSGCGKTTTLRLLAGLEMPDEGEVWLNGRRVAGDGVWVAPEDRHIGMVFQDYALFPHLNITQNITFALNALPQRERGKRADEMLALVGLAGAGERYPHQLSGGQQQRVALARALAPRPSVILLDEPFSNLDAALRKEMREEMGRILREAGATAVFVTHDQEEALSIADRVAVMQTGRVLQLDTPQRVYLLPASREVAAFVGEANFVPGMAQGETVLSALGALPLAQPARGEVDVVVRPEALLLEPDAAGRGEVESVYFYGHDQVAVVRLDDLRLSARMWPRPDITAGARVALRVRGEVVAFEV
jgi:iron(III) transport system ATP-binding protein